MFYVKNLFIFLPRHFLQNSLSGLRQLPQLRNSTMVDLEGLPPPSAAASHHKVSHRHCGQVGCCFSLLIVLCLLCLLRFVFSFLSPSSLFALLTRSFFLSSLSFLLLGCHLFLGSRPRAAPFLGSSPRQCSFLVPFLGLGGAPALSLPRPRRCSCSVPSSASVVLLPGHFLGLVRGPRLFSLALVLLLGASPSPRCSARNLRPRLGSPSWLLGIALVLLIGSSPWSHDSVLCMKPLASRWFSSLASRPCLGSHPRSHSSALEVLLGPVLRSYSLAVLWCSTRNPWLCSGSLVSVPLLGSNWSHGAPHETLSSQFLSLGAPIR
jgi:hypothetical protein